MKKTANRSEKSESPEVIARKLAESLFCRPPNLDAAKLSTNLSAAIKQLGETLEQAISNIGNPKSD